MNGRRSLRTVAASLTLAALSCAMGPEPQDVPRPSARALVAQARASGAIAARAVSSPRAMIRVELPASAAGRAVIEDPRSTVRTAVTLVGAREASAEKVDEIVVHRDALGAGVDLLRLVVPGAMEDLLVFAARPAEERVRFRLDVTDVAGLRMVDGTLELLDTGGAPRLRVARPFVVDAAGTRHPARLSLAGCAHDDDPRAPWGRSIVAPGARSCDLVVDWSGAGARYPLVVDPLWTSTGAMSAARMQHTATLLASGKVLVAGGDGASAALASSELYDPATGTFALTGTLATARYLHSASLLGSGKVLAAGGVGGGSTAELYDPATGMWSGTGAMNASRQSHAHATLANGKVLVASLTTAELYDPATGAWTPTTGAPKFSRIAHGAVPLANGKALVAGGSGATAAAELFDPTTGEFTLTGAMSGPGRTRFTASLLPDGRVLVAGGSISNSAVASVEIYDPVAGTWAAGPPLAAPRTLHAAATLASGNVMVVGGLRTSVTRVVTAELFDPVTSKWTSLASMNTARDSFTATRLPSGAFLVAGGRISTVPTEMAEILSGQPNGTVCTVADDCTTGVCVDGVCCDRPCGACEACSAAKKGGGSDGVCEPIPAGADPDGDCAEEPVSTCGRSGTCDGKGACAKYAAGTVCVPEVCSVATVTTSVCDGAGVCAPAAKNCAPYDCVTTGITTECRTSCDSHADCAPGSACNVSLHECISGTTCDGAHTLTDPAGATIDCSPYTCDGSECKQGCSSVKDCVEGFVCTLEGVCLPADSEGGVAGCDVASTPANGRTAILISAVGLALALASRRRPRREG